MARKIEKFPEELRPGTTAARYPWHEWLDGDVWELEQGEDKDFTIKVKSLRTSAQNMARARGGRAKVAEHPDGRRLYVQFIPRPQAAEPPESAAETGSEPRAARDTADRDRAAAIRSWAREHGWPDLPDRGRLPGEVVESYDRAMAHPHNVHHLSPR